MKAVVYKEPKVLALITDAAKPEPSPHQVLLETKAVGICGSDLGIYEGKFPKINPPLIIGHEGGGIVRAVGEKVTTVKEGDHVTVSPVLYCGRCEYCKRGEYILCDDGATIGMIDAQGEYAEFFVAPEQNCHLLPDDLSWTVAALVDTLAGPVHETGRIDVPLRSSVAVFGPGPAGLFFCRLAKLRGASKVYLIGTREERLRLGPQYGADVTINIHAESAVDLILGYTRGRGVDIVIEAAGSQQALTDGFQVLRKGGVFLAYGVYHGGPVSVDMQRVVLNEFSVLGVCNNTDGYPVAIELLSMGIIDVAPLITHTFTLDDLPKAFASGLIKERRDGYIKGVVVF